jgi:BASS family bile acid:Na+ symporter
MMKQINRFFSVILLGACLTGMFIPSFGESTAIVVIVSLALIIFSSFFQINLSFQSLMTDFKISLQFIIIRFVLLPVVLFLIIDQFDSLSALIVLLILLLPAGVSSPAFTVLFGGKADMSLKILLFTSFISIITIPFILRLLLGAEAEVPVGNLLLTLLWTIVIPFLVHLPLRKFKSVRNVMLEYNSLFTLVCLCVLGITVTAKNKSTILENPGLIGIYAVVSFLMYAVMYILGYMFIPKGDHGIRKTLAVSSGANNIGLGVTITTLFFAGKMNVYFIISQILWVLVLIPVRHWLLKKQG